MKAEELHPLEIIRAEACAVARCFGVAAADEMAASLVERVRAQLTGHPIYIPECSSAERKKIHSEIIARHAGTSASTASLAREYGITPRAVRKILDRYRK